MPDQTDAEGDPASAWTPAPPTPTATPLTYAASGLPAGLSIDRRHRPDQRHHRLRRRQRQPLHGRPSPSATASAVDDSDTFSWTVSNTNQDPTFDQDCPTRPTPRVTIVSLDAGATDPDGDPLTYAASGLPAGLSIDAATGLISGTIAFNAASGSPYTVDRHRHATASAVDASDTFSWTVSNTNQDPTFDQDMPDQTNAEGDASSAWMPAPPTPTATR